MKSTAAIVASATLVTATLLSLAPPALAQTGAPKVKAEATSAMLSKEDEQEIRKLPMGFEEAWNTHDMQILAKLFRPDAEFINVVGMHWRGRDAIVKAHEIFHKIMFKDCRLKTDSIEIRPLGVDEAVALWTSTQDSFTTPDGNVVPKGQTRLSLIVTKGSDGWKIAHAHNVRVDAQAANNDPINSGPQ